MTRTVQKEIGRVLLDGGNRLRDTTNFYSTRREFLDKHPEVLKVFFEELEKAELWTKANPTEITELLAPVTQLDPAALKVIYDKTEWGVQPITSQIITKQQEVADLWFGLNLIPKKVDVKEGFLSNDEYSKVIPEVILAKV